MDQRSGDGGEVGRAAKWGKRGCIQVQSINRASIAADAEQSAVAYYSAPSRCIQTSFLRHAGLSWLPSRAAPQPADTGGMHKHAQFCACSLYDRRSGAPNPSLLSRRHARLAAHLQRAEDRRRTSRWHTTHQAHLHSWHFGWVLKACNTPQPARQQRSHQLLLESHLDVSSPGAAHLVVCIHGQCCK